MSAPDRRPLRTLLVANALSTAGTSMTFLAVPWFVLVTTGSAARTGVVAACETVPLVLASALGGPLIDRLGARRAAVGSDVLSGAGILVVPVLHGLGVLAFWQLCLAVAVVGLCRAPGDTARAVLVPGLVERAQTPLERATAAFDGVERGARMIGAPLAGLLIAVTSPATVLVVNAVTFVVSAVLVQRAVPLTRVEQQAEPGSYLTRLREGLAFIRKDRLLLGITVMVMVTNLLDASWSAVLLPYYARKVLDSSVALGLLFAVFGLGALTGTLLYGVYGPRLPRWPVFTAAFLVCGAPRFGVLATEPAYSLLVVAQLTSGLAAGALNPVLTAVEYERIPAALQSRVLGAASAGVLAGMPLGALLAGAAIEQIGFAATVAIAAGSYLLATLSPLLTPCWRQMDATRARAPSPRPAPPPGR